MDEIRLIDREILKKKKKKRYLYRLLSVRRIGCPGLAFGFVFLCSSQLSRIESPPKG